MTFEPIIDQVGRDRAKMRADEATTKLLDRGYFWSEVFGWELPINIEIVGFTVDEALNFKGIPTKPGVVQESYTKSVPETDAYGAKTGRYREETVVTGERDGFIIDPRYAEYVKLKNARYRQWLAKKYNEPNENSLFDNDPENRGA